MAYKCKNMPVTAYSRRTDRTQKDQKETTTLQKE